MSIYRNSQIYNPNKWLMAATFLTKEISKEMEKSKVNVNLPLPIEKNVFKPRVDVQELNDKYLLNVELAGVNKENVKISVLDDGSLNISGKKEKLHHEEGKTYLRNERMYGEFNRQFILPENADLSNISASYTNGVLEISVLKTLPKVPKETVIEIK